MVKYLYRNRVQMPELLLPEMQSDPEQWSQPWLYLLGEVISWEPHADLRRQWNSETLELHCTGLGCRSHGVFNELPDNKNLARWRLVSNREVLACHPNSWHIYIYSVEEHFQHPLATDSNDSSQPHELFRSNMTGRKVQRTATEIYLESLLAWVHTKTYNI